MTRIFFFVVGWAVVGAAACGGRGASRADAAADVPVAVDPRAAVCAEVEAGAATVGFDVVQAIFTYNCTICHAPGNDLDLVAGAAWGDLVGQPAPSAEACGGTLVVPGNPDASYLYQKLTNPSPCSGSQMPRTDLLPDPLPACVIALVRTWIEEGAPGSPADGAADAPPGD